MRRNLREYVRSVWGERKTEIALFAASLLLRAILLALLAWWAAVAPDFDGRPSSEFPIVGGDSIDYSYVAKNIATYGDVSSSDEPPLLPASFRTPGYPLFEAVFLKLGFGFVGVSVAQIILSSLTVVLVYSLARRFIGRKVALLASILFMLEPNAVYYSFIALSDTLFVFLQMLSLWLMVRASEAGERRAYAYLLLSGAVLGYSVLVRPIAQFLPVLFLAALLALVWRKWAVSIKSTAVVAFVLGFALLVAPWSMRNHRVFGTYQISSVTAVTFHSYNAPMYYAYKNGGSYEDAKKLFDAKVPGEPGTLEYRSLWNAPLLMDAAMDYISSDWFGYARFHLLKTIPFFVTDGVRDILRTIQVLKPRMVNYSDLLLAGNFTDFSAAVSMVEPAIIILVVFAGFWTLIHMATLAAALDAIRRRDWKALAFIGACVALILYYAVLTGPVANSRYRLPAEPFMLMSAAAGFAAVRRKLPLRLAMLRSI